MAQIEFCCTPAEEREFLEWLLGSDEVVPLTKAVCNPRKLPIPDLEDLPRWPEPVEFLIWHRASAPIRWIRSRPRSTGKSPQSFKAAMFAQETWDRLRPHRGQALIDVERTPLLVYSRAQRREGRRVSPSMLHAPASSLRGISQGFEAWVRRVFGRIRETAKRAEELSLPGLPFGTVYAFPGAMEDIRSGKSRFAAGLEPDPEPEQPPARPPVTACMHLPATDDPDNVELKWVVSPRRLRGKGAAFLNLARARCPDAVPVRFKDEKSGWKFLKPSEKDFVEMWDRASRPGEWAELSWRCHRGAFGFVIPSWMSEWDAPRKPREFVRIYALFRYGSAAKDPELSGRIEHLFAAVAQLLGALYGTIRALSVTESDPLTGCLSWPGIPRHHPWRTWFGEAYRKPVSAALKGFDVQSFDAGLLLRMGPELTSDARLCRKYPRLPERLLLRGTLDESERAPTVPRII